MLNLKTLILEEVSLEANCLDEQGKPEETLAKQLEALEAYAACSIGGSSSTPAYAALLHGTGITYESARDGPSPILLDAFSYLPYSHQICGQAPMFEGRLSGKRFAH